MTHAKRRADKVLYINSEGKRKYGSYEGFQSIQRFEQKINDQLFVYASGRMRELKG